jgi:hypothetical protein
MDTPNNTPLGTLGQRLMNVSLATMIRKLRQRGFLPKPSGDDLLDQIPRIALSEIVDRPMVRIEGTYSYVDGSLPLCDLLALLSILVDRSPQTVMEIGTFNGYTTRLMALNLPNAEIHTIDLPENFSDSGAGMPKDDWHLISARRVGSEYRADPSITSIKQHFGDTAEYVFPTAEIFFIDGSHTYAYVRNDTEKALMSSATKTLIWHDCDRDHPGVTRWLLEMSQTGHPVRHIEGTSLAILELRNHA